MSRLVAHVSETARETILQWHRTPRLRTGCGSGPRVLAREDRGAAPTGPANCRRERRGTGGSVAAEELGARAEASQRSASATDGNLFPRIAVHDGPGQAARRDVGKGQTADPGSMSQGQAPLRQVRTWGHGVNLDQEPGTRGV